MKVLQRPPAGEDGEPLQALLVASAHFRCHHFHLRFILILVYNIQVMLIGANVGVFVSPTQEKRFICLWLFWLLLECNSIYRFDTKSSHYMNSQERFI